MNKTVSSIVRVGIFSAVLVVMLIVGFFMGMFDFKEGKMPSFGFLEIVEVIVMASGTIIAASLLQFFLFK